MTDRPTSTTRPPSSSADCPGCGRFMGPAGECPYCGAEAGGRTALRCLRWAALVFGIGGLLVLFVAARTSEWPLVSAATLGPSMNHGQVRIRGTVVSSPRVFDRQGQPDYASFELDDGTGRIVVAATRRTARSLVSEHLLPAKGERVEAAGSLAIGLHQRPRLYLDSPGRLTRLDARQEAPRPGRATPPPPSADAAREET